MKIPVRFFLSLLMVGTSQAIQQEDCILSSELKDPAVDTTTSQQIRNFFSFFSSPIDNLEVVQETIHEVPNLGKEKVEINDSLDPTSQAWIALPTKKQCAKFGAGILVVIGIGGAVYLLYKNGTLKKITQKIYKNRRIATGALVTTAAVVVGLVYWVKNQPVLS